MKKKQKKASFKFGSSIKQINFGRLLTPHHAARKGDLMHLIKSNAQIDSSCKADRSLSGDQSKNSRSRTRPSGIASKHGQNVEAIGQGKESSSGSSDSSNEEEDEDKQHEDRTGAGASKRAKQRSAVISGNQSSHHVNMFSQAGSHVQHTSTEMSRRGSTYARAVQ